MVRVTIFEKKSKRDFFGGRLYTESGLKLLGLDLTSLATQGVCAEAQPNAIPATV